MAGGATGAPGLAPSTAAGSDSTSEARQMQQRSTLYNPPPLSSALPARKKKLEKPASSCSECRRRKQKCNQGKPCNNCFRRFPQPICEYDKKLPQKSRRIGSTLLEDPASSVTDIHGPYSHLKNSGLQDAILQIELPTRITKRKAIEGGQRLPIPESDSLETWKPFTTQHPTQDESVANKTFSETIRRVVQRLRDNLGPVLEDVWDRRAAGVIRLAEEARSPANPIGNVFQHFRFLPMAQTRLNKELVRTYLQVLSRYHVSIDGSPAPDNPFLLYYVPIMVQDPLVLQTTLYTSACFLRETGHLPKTLTMAYKGSAYQMLNTTLRDEKTQCTDAAILAVCTLVVDEWYWGATNDLRAHILGLKMMVLQRGGLKTLGAHGYLAKTILMDDVAMALAHEILPTLFDQPGCDFEDPVMVPFQMEYNSPFLSGWPTFAGSSLAGRLSYRTATVLDEMQTLIDTVLTGLDGNLEHTDPQKVIATVLWMQERLDATPEERRLSQHPQISRRRSAPDEPASPPPQDEHDNSNPDTQSPNNKSLESAVNPSHLWVRKVALIYCRAIYHRQPFSIACTAEDFQYLWDFTWRMQTRAYWTTTGIFFWVSAALAPSCHAHPGARFLKTTLTSSVNNLGIDDWHVATYTMRRALKLQHWLRRGTSSGMAVYGGEFSVDKHGYAATSHLPHIGLTQHYEDGEDQDD